ncbi:MAG: tetratricopeptide repeat protein [Bacteroidota bacterium]
MKNVNLKPFAVFALAAVVLSGCAGLNKMKKNADQIQFNVTPEVLETHAGEVDVAVNGKFPAKYFNKKATLVATPVIRHQEGETAFEPVTMQGEKVEANNKVISYNAGGSFSYNDATDFVEAMRKSELYVNITASKGSKSVDFDPIKIADGVIATSTMVANFPKAVLGVRREANNSGKYDPNIDPFQRVVPDEMLADIHYLINRANLRGEEITAEDVEEFLRYTEKANQEERIDLKEVEVSAYASPDGEIDFNTDLAADRKNTSSDFLAQKLKEAGVDINLKTRYTPEDWEGFKEKLEESNIQDKELILRVLSMYTDPEVREREIRNLSETFTILAEEILPELRRAKLLTSVELVGKTDEELSSLAKSDPASLNPAELLYAATLYEGLDDQLEIYNSFQRVYPDDWRGPNNAGYVLVKQMNYDDAKPLFEKAERLNNDEPIIKNNLGAIALNENNVDQAETLFGSASGAGEEVNYNLGIVSIKKANYDQAVRYFSDYQDINSALAKILTGNNNGALRDLEAFERENCFMKEYLKAVIGARTARENLLFDSLEEAVSINPEMKAKAKTDLEFANYFNDARFTEIVN